MLKLMTLTTHNIDNYQIVSPFTYVIPLKASIIFINHNTIQSMKLYDMHV